MLRSSGAVRTFILGVTAAGRVVQHDPGTPEIVVLPEGGLLGAPLSDIVPDTDLAGPSLAAVLDAIASGREATVTLPVRTRTGPLSAVVSVQPMRGAGAPVAALIVVGVPRPADERFLGRALTRHALLDDTFREIGTMLDPDETAQRLITILVAHFCNSASLLVPESPGSAAGAQPVTGESPLRRLATASDSNDPRWEAAFPVGEVLRYPPRTPQRDCLDQRKPVSVPAIPASGAAEVARSGSRGPAAGLLAQASMLVLPLMAEDSVAGLIVCIRRAGFRDFDPLDTDMGMEFASRAAILIENARRYDRERITALTVQRSLLPDGLSTPSSVEIGHRYLPGGQLMEPGGDWYEAVALPGARSTLAIGDVAGHGVRAAVTMGGLRTAIQALAMLELAPADTLGHLDELMQVIGVREPHLATCLHATYDAVSGTCEMASAGHLPPLLVAPDGTSSFLDLEPAPPLGAGDGPIHGSTFEIEDGSLLVLYTGGLVERPGRDISDGLARLRAAFGPGAADRSMDELCDAAVASTYDEQPHDDIAILIARLHRIDPARHISFELPGEPATAAQARSLAAEPLTRWDLTSLLPATQLLISELVTNAIIHAQGTVTLHLIHEDSLVCEVHDTSPALPRLRHACCDDETGRGLEIVSQVSHRWGARPAAHGKIVWCELRAALP